MHAVNNEINKKATFFSKLRPAACQQESNLIHGLAAHKLKSAAFVEVILQLRC